jgi:hypothetical protein
VVALGADAQVGVGLGAGADLVGLAQRFDQRLVVGLEPFARGLLAVQQLAALLAGAKRPGLDGLGKHPEAAWIARLDAPCLRARQRDALAEHALVALAWEIGDGQLPVGADARQHLDDVRLDLLDAQRAGNGHAVVAVAHEVRVADAVDVDRRQRLAAAHRGCDALPTRPHAGRRRAKRAIEARRAVDGPDDRVDRDHLHAQVALAEPAQGFDHFGERQDQIEVAGAPDRACAQVRKRPAAPCTHEVVLRVC